MGRRQAPAKRRGTPTAALAAAAMLLLLGGLAALISSGAVHVNNCTKHFDNCYLCMRPIFDKDLRRFCHASAGPNIYGMHLDWTASRAAGRNASAVTASGLLDSSSPLRSTGADPVADVAVQPFGDAELVSTQQQAGSGAATSSIGAQATKTQQSGSSSDSGGSGSVEQGPDRMIIVAHLAEDLSWQVMTRLCSTLTS